MSANYNIAQWAWPQWLDGALVAVQEPGLWAQLGVIVAGAAGAWLIHRYWGRYLGSLTSETRAGLRGDALATADRIIFPFSMLLVVLVMRSALEALAWPTQVLDLAVPLLLSLGLIRLAVFLLRRVLRPGPLLVAWEHSIGTAIWVLVALHLLGWLPGLLQALDGIALEVGANRISLLAMIKLLVFGAITLVFALWATRWIERYLDGAAHLSAGMRVGVAKFARVSLITIALLLALGSIGIDLTALTVFGGALGVGLGFGLQRIASNFISGFILIFDRSIRPGDVITVGDSFGWVRALHARYVVIRNRDGVEMLIPNENLITSEVINWSFSDRHVRVKIPVQISYEDDPEKAMALMLEAAASEPRVRKDPAPAARLTGFGESGIDLELRVWIDDPEEGATNVRSNVNLAIWRAFRDAAVTIPYPQRDVHLFNRSGET